MKTVTIDKSRQGFDALDYVGRNLLEGIEPEIRSIDGSIPEMKNIKTFYDEKAHLELTLPFKLDKHIDIFSDNFTVTYPLSGKEEINTAFISGFSNGNYMIGDFELFFADEKETLYSEENCIAHVDNSGIYREFGSNRHSEVFIGGLNVNAKFFGIRVNKACGADDICRISHIALYNDEETESLCFIKRNYKITNKLSSESVEGIEGDAAILFDGNCFTDACVYLSELILAPEHKIENLMLTGDFGDFDVYSADDKEKLFSDEALKIKTEEKETGNAFKSVFVELPEKSKKYVGIKFESKASLQEIGGYTFERFVKADLDTIRNKDFIGVGANELPMAMMPESRMDGFRDVYWPVYENRMIKAKPSVLRLWFQVDWVVLDEEDYKKGVCNFSLPKFRSVLKYLDVYEKAGIDVLFNFGWKNGTEIQSWFSVPRAGVGPRNGTGLGSSAPKDFDGFAKTCASVIRELCQNRGYKCIKYLTFYNESAYGDRDTPAADFVGYPGHALEKWDEMFCAVRNELIEQKLDHLVDFWLSEVSGSDKIELEWMDFFSGKYPEINKMNTFHRYERTYDTRLQYFKEVKETCKGQPAVASEFAVYTEPTWEASDMEYVMSLLRSGLSGGLYWTFQGVMMTDPTWLGLRGGWWSPAYLPNGLKSEGNSYHHLSLFTHYLPIHSEVLECSVDDNDVRAEVIRTPDGEYTVFVENKPGLKNKPIEIDFGKKLNRKFRKHVLRLDFKKDGNLMVPPAEKEFEVSDKLKDTIETEYCLIAYTSLPEFKQVKMDSTEVFCPLGESIKLGCELIGCEGEIEWSIESSEGAECYIDENGVFSQGEYVIPANRYCVKAQLKGDELTYGTAIVKIGAPEDQPPAKVVHLV